MGIHIIGIVAVMLLAVIVILASMFVMTEVDRHNRFKEIVREIKSEGFVIIDAREACDEAIIDALEAKQLVVYERYRVVGGYHAFPAWGNAPAEGYTEIYDFKVSFTESGALYNFPEKFFELRQFLEMSYK